jgi:hypothetical protein
MKAIWEDQYRKIKEIDQACKRKLKRLFIIVRLILITVAITL